MMDSHYYLTNKDAKDTVAFTVRALEALSWLHQCSKIQVQEEILGEKILRANNFWVVTRNSCKYFSKTVQLGLADLPEGPKQIIEDCLNHLKAKCE